MQIYNEIEGLTMQVYTIKHHKNIFTFLNFKDLSIKITPSDKDNYTKIIFYYQGLEIEDFTVRNFNCRETVISEIYNVFYNKYEIDEDEIIKIVIKY